MSSRNAEAAGQFPADNSDHLWTIKQAAAYLGVAVATVYQWVSQGKRSADPIPTIHLSTRCLRFPINKLKAWANRRGNDQSGDKAGKGGAL
jgi:predicted DNA-binding transcriptional regulator AlpA